MATRTLTDTATVTWDEATAGQVKANVPDQAIGTDKLTDDGVTNAKLAEVTQGTLKGRQIAGGTGNPEDLTQAQAKAVLGLATSTTDNAIIRADGTDGDTQTSGVVIDDSNNVSGLVNLTQTGYQDIAEIAAPSNPAANVARLYVQDDGLGTTQARMRDSAGNVSFLGGRERLLANRTYFVRTDGNDSNTGLANTSGGAFLTIERARQAVYALDLNGFTATIKLADGTYTAGVICNGMPPGAAVASPIIFEGNTSTPANVIISTTSSDCFIAQNGANIYVTGVEMRTTTSGSCMRAIKGGQIIHGNVRFGTSAGFHVETADGGRRYNDGNFSIVGGAVAHQHVTSGGFQLLANCTVTLTGTPAFSQYFVGLSGGYAQYTACTFSGSATGIRFLNHEGGIINTDGQSMTTYLPGNTAGVNVNATFDDFYDDVTFAAGGAIDWGTGDVNITHSTNQLNFNGASEANGYQFDALVRSGGGIKSVSPSAGVGYLTGAGGTVTQLTSKSTAVTLNRPTGQITMNNAALAGGAVVDFGVINSAYSATAGDTVIAHHVSGGTVGAYSVAVLANGSSTFVLRVTNLTGGSLSEAIVINFNIIKGATS